MSKMRLATVAALFLFATPALAAKTSAGDCPQTPSDATGALTADVSAAAGQAKLDALIAGVTQTIEQSGWVHSGYGVKVYVPGVNEFVGHSKSGDGIVALFVKTFPQTAGASLHSIFRPNRFSKFTVFVRVHADGTLARDVYGRAQIERFESLGRFYKLERKLDAAKDVAKDVMKDPKTLKGLGMGAIAVGAQVVGAFTGTTPIMTAVSSIFGYKGLETITQSIQRVRAARAKVLADTVSAVGKQAAGKTEPTYQQAYQLYLENMKKAGLSSMLGPTEFFKELNDAGIFLD